MIFLGVACALVQSPQEQPNRGASSTQQPFEPDPRGTSASATSPMQYWAHAIGVNHNNQLRYLSRRIDILLEIMAKM
jgi:hypothetical protein